jgi:hypothetical protein
VPTEVFQKVSLFAHSLALAPSLSLFFPPSGGDDDEGDDEGASAAASSTPKGDGRKQPVYVVKMNGEGSVYYHDNYDSIGAAALSVSLNRPKMNVLLAAETFDGHYHSATGAYYFSSSSLPSFPSVASVIAAETSSAAGAASAPVASAPAASAAVASAPAASAPVAASALPFIHEIDQAELLHKTTVRAAVDEEFDRSKTYWIAYPEYRNKWFKARFLKGDKIVFVLYIC